MSLRRVVLVSLLAGMLGTAALPGVACCQSVPIYSHVETSEIDKSQDLGNPALAPFTASGVVIAPILIQGNPRVRLRFYANTKKVLRLTSLELAGTGPKASNRQRVRPAKDVALTPSKRKPGLFKAHETVFLPIDGDAFDEMGEHGFELTVKVRVDGAKEESIKFQIDRHTKTIPACGGW